MINLSMLGTGIPDAVWNVFGGIFNSPVKKVESIEEGEKFSMVKIAIVNQTTHLTDTDVLPVVKALQIQLDHDFAFYYGYSAELYWVDKGKQPRPNMSQLVLLDNSDDAGALGYHDLTKDGYPLGKVFVETTRKSGGKWTVTASHEMLEMMADPTINLSVEVGNILVAYEIADPVERDEDGYDINGISVSNFVLPAYFEPVNPFRTKFDIQGKLKKPAPTMLPGGYLSISKHIGSWTEIYADKVNVKYTDRATLGSRREKRRTPKENWMRSKQ